MFFFFFFLFFLVLLLLFLFFYLGKSSSNDYFLGSSFECGFSSYFFSRYSFSIHYFMVGLIFLFLDLELGFCFLLVPFDYASLSFIFSFSSFISVLLAGLIFETLEGNIMWID